jgi:hypothetical protein
VTCADASNDNGWTVPPSGTSQATALTAGVAAYLLSDTAIRNSLAVGGVQNVPMNMKNFLIAQSMAAKGAWTDGVPRLSLNFGVDCSSPSAAGDVPAIPVFVPPLSSTVGLVLNTEPVTSGTTVEMGLNILVRHPFMILRSSALLMVVSNTATMH